MYVLITRPEDKARQLEQELQSRGYATIVEPLLVIERLGTMSALPGDIQALALTSAEAAPALSDAAKRLPVFTVGEATAAAARKAGCSQVIEGNADAAALAVLIGTHCRPENGAILHLAGEVVREDLKRILEEQGFEFRQNVVYRALSRTKFSPTLRAAWQRREIAAVLLFSPRTAETLVRLLIEDGLTDHVDTATAICVSEAAATPCRALVWRDICLAVQPNRAAMLKALEGSIGIC